MNEEYFTIPEVAKKLKVTRAAVYKWIAQGKLAVVYVGSDRRITSNAIADFVRASTQARLSEGASHDTIEERQAPVLTPATV
jgi:excisionase family DNA binding protein